MELIEGGVVGIEALRGLGGLERLVALPHEPEDVRPPRVQVRVVGFHGERAIDRFESLVVLEAVEIDLGHQAVGQGRRFFHGLFQEVVGLQGGQVYRVHVVEIESPLQARKLPGAPVHHRQRCIGLAELRIELHGLFQVLPCVGQGFSRQQPIALQTFEDTRRRPPGFWYPCPRRLFPRWT